MKLVVAPFEYTRRDYTPRKGDPPRHDWIRDRHGHKAIGQEVATLIDEIERLRSELDAAQLRSIEARNPGIDMDAVRRHRSGETTP